MNKYVLGLLLLCFWACQSPNGKAVDLNARLNKLIEKRNYAQAQVIADSAIRSGQKSAELFFQGGVIAEALSEDYKALGYYQKAIELSPNDINATLNLAILYERLGDYEKAYQLHGRVLKMSPQNVLSLFRHASIAQNLKQLDVAKADLEVLISIDSNYCVPQNLLGLVYEDLHFSENAISRFDRAISLCPDTSVFYFNRSVSEYNLGNYQSAIADVRIAINKESDTGRLGLYYFNQGLFLLKDKRKGEACECFFKSQQLGFGVDERALDDCK